MANAKLASEASQLQRGKAFSKVALIAMFVIFMSIPILNLLFGMGFFIWFSVNIFARSGQRGKDFLWLLLGSFICLFAIALPVFMEHNRISYGQCWFYGFMLNVVVGVFIAGNRLGHLFEESSTGA
ncbi:hypothetical protein [Caballeronia sp. BR00000012568055]|uniref:hypothetical protein n=1 Tax=Caballeronia sp. BR00000012568055 TaxID=2918761 RepID=UPI0023F9208C|nr:hypothetical protein [Caballeronia sp. BR00000012568055]